MPRAIALLAEDYLDNPVKVVVAPPATTVERIDQGVVFVPNERKRDVLATILRDPAFARVLVFTRTKHGADRVTRYLVDAGINAAAIHGNKSQPQRERALAGFREGRARVLVATDIAARGIDVDGVSHVINFELPAVPEDYVHRIGRTARAGAAGIAIAFCSDEERSYLRDIEKLTRNSLRPMSAPAGFGQSGPTGQSVEAAPRKTAPRSISGPGPELPRHPRQGAIGANTRGKEAIPAGTLPAFLRRRPAGNANPGARRSHRRESPAARYAGAR
jgi:ATP-dependent RNA helicase RhlE